MPLSRQVMDVHEWHTVGMAPGLACPGAGAEDADGPPLGMGPLEMGPHAPAKFPAAEGSQMGHQEEDARDANNADNSLHSQLAFQEMLGSGAQAEVYRGIWWKTIGNTTSAITVAIKRLRQTSGKTQRAFFAEQLARGVHHPNLVRCFDTTTTAPYLIVSEFCSGGTLHDCIHDTEVNIAWSQRLKVLVDVAKAMEYLHSCTPCILHRDLKSVNVMLTRKLTTPSRVPIAKVADFGLSRQLFSDTEVNGMTRCVGTWRWMAPEVFSSTHYTERIDVFSFAILMYEVLSRKVPYADTWAVNSNVNPRIGLHIVNGHRPNLDNIQSGCPAQAVELMQESWHKDPEARPDFPTARKKLENQLELVNIYSQMKNLNNMRASG